MDFSPEELPVQAALRGCGAQRGAGLGGEPAFRPACPLLSIRVLSARLHRNTLIEAGSVFKEADSAFWGSVYAVAPDGKRILVNRIMPDFASLEVIVNWPALLKK